MSSHTVSGYRVTRYGPQIEPVLRETWNIVVTEQPSGEKLVDIPMTNDSDSKRVVDEIKNLLKRFTNLDEIVINN